MDSLSNLNQKCLFILVLSGNVQPQKNISTPDEFIATLGLGISHVNVQSLFPKVATWVTMFSSVIMPEEVEPFIYIKFVLLSCTLCLSANSLNFCL